MTGPARSQLQTVMSPFPSHSTAPLKPQGKRVFDIRIKKTQKGFRFWGMIDGSFVIPQES